MDAIEENSQSYLFFPICKNMLAYIYRMLPKYKIPKKTSNSSKIKSSANKSSRDSLTLVTKALANVMQNVDSDSSRKAKKAKKAIQKQRKVSQNQEYTTKNQSIQKVLVAYQDGFDSRKVQNKMLKLVGQMFNPIFLDQLEELLNKASKQINFESKESNILARDVLVGELVNKLIDDSKKEYLEDLPPWQYSAVLRLIHEDQVAKSTKDMQFQSEKEIENEIKRRFLPLHSHYEYLAWRKKQVRQKQPSQADQIIDLSDSPSLSDIVESSPYKNILQQDVENILGFSEQFQSCKQQPSQIPIEYDATDNDISQYFCVNVYCEQISYISNE